MTDNRRVVITGIGVIAPSGIGKKEFWEGLKVGKNCVDKITFFDCSQFPSKVAAEIKNFNPKDFINGHEIHRMSRSSHLAITAALLAFKDAGFKTQSQVISEMGVIVGSGTTGLDYAEVDFRALEKWGVEKMRPFAGIAGFGGALSSEISRTLKTNNLSITISTGCTASTDAMGYALNMIRFGKADIIITGGADACITPGILGAFCQMGAVSTNRNDQPAKACRPFNRDRDGFVISEGSWIFIFEELTHAIERNAHIYAEAIGYGATCDAWHMSKPYASGDFFANAYRLVLKDAKVDRVDLISAYGNATPINDSYETMVIKKVFGEQAYKIPVVSIKSMLGHPLGASGAQELAGAILALEQGIIHPTINYDVPDPECDLDYVPNISRRGNINVVLCSSLAFGGKNSALIVRKYTGRQ